MTRVVLVTGAAGGLGSAVCAALLDQGHMTVLAARSIERLGQQHAQLVAHPNAMPLELDVCNPAHVAAARTVIGQRFGRLDGLANTAGVFVADALTCVDFDRMRGLLDVNVLGPWRMLVGLLPLLSVSPVARVVNVSSTTASLGLTAGGADLPGDGTRRTGYAASKAALNMLTLQWQAALSRSPEHRHIAVHAVSPGYIATGMNNFSAPESPDAAAQFIARLLTGDEGQPACPQLLAREGSLPW